MKSKKISSARIKIYPVFFLTILLLASCKNEDSGLAPYEGSVKMSNVTVEDSTYTPKITWVGGYAEVVGINRGTHAALDSTLVWLIYKPNNGLKYPVKFGVLPEGAQDLTQQYGGLTSNLLEDNTYTYWVMKEDMWNQISLMRNKIIQTDSVLSSGYQVVADTIRISSASVTQKSKNIDKYINIYEITNTGIKLGVISIAQTDTSNTPIISWTITQAGVTDQAISAMGICEGNQYDPSKIIWEVYSEESINGVTVYGKKNIINRPVYPLNSLTGVHVFKEYPPIQLERNKGYYVWIANKDWNQSAASPRLRITDYYAFVTFKTR